MIKIALERNSYCSLLLGGDPDRGAPVTQAGGVFSLPGDLLVRVTPTLPGPPQLQQLKKKANPAIKGGRGMNKAFNPTQVNSV